MYHSNIINKLSKFLKYYKNKSSALIRLSMITDLPELKETDEPDLQYLYSLPKEICTLKINIDPIDVFLAVHRNKLSFNSKKYKS